MPAISRKDRTTIQFVSSQGFTIFERDRLIEKYSQMYYFDPSICEMYDHDEFIESALRHNYYYETTIKSQFITINPAPGVDLMAIRNCLNSISTSVMDNLHWVLEFRYSFEQRGKTIGEMGTGIHVHILAKIDYSHNLCELTKFIRRNILKYRLISKDNITNPSIYNIVKIHKMVDYQKRIDYLEGKKQDKKIPSVKIDKIFRQKNNLLSMYRVK